MQNQIGIQSASELQQHHRLLLDHNDHSRNVLNQQNINNYQSHPIMQNPDGNAIAQTQAMIPQLKEYKVVNIVQNLQENS